MAISTTSSTPLTKTVSDMIKKPGNITTPPQPQINTPKPATTNTPTSTGDMASKLQSAESDVKSVPAKPNMETCSKVINESETLIEAFESVCAMYACPAQILQDDTLDSIKVTGDTIIAPGISPKGKENAIIRSISAVLDYISQRIDEKLNDFHYDTIQKGALDEHIQNVSNPNKGKVISRHIDPDGNEVIAYDTGLVDMTSSKTAQQFVAELRESGVIPQIKKVEEPQIVGRIEKKPVQYFTDDDDIMKGVDWTGVRRPVKVETETDGDISPISSSTPMNITTNTINTPDTTLTADERMDLRDDNQVTQTDVSNTIGESADILNLVSKYGNTRHLGYDIFTEQGFKNVKPVDFFEESAKEIPVTDIKHLKFDNTHLIKAIKYFNAARAEQPEAKGNVINMTALVNSKNWDNGIKEIEKQFDCHLSLKFVNSTDNPRSTNASTTVLSEVNQYRQKCTVSKSKGFQLNGLPVNVYIINQMFTRNAPTDPNLFGQAATSIILHEIFHNIMAVMRTYNVEFNSMLATTVIAVQSAKSSKVRRKLLENFISASEKLGMMHMNSKQKKTYIKKMLLICSMRDNKENREIAEKLVSNTDDDIVNNIIKRKEAKIDDVKNMARKEINDRSIEIKSAIAMALSLSVAGAGVMTIKGALFGIGLVGMVLSGISFSIGKAARLSKNKEFNKEMENLEKGMYRDKDLEEHWCDMFAAMYNLPLTFFHNDDYKITANKMTIEQIKRIHELEIKWGNIINDPHPATTERLSASVKAAQATLNSGVKLDPCVKDYLEWIVANHSKLLEVDDINNLYNANNFDPKSAEDLDAHIQSLITKSGVQVTEQVVYNVLSC